MKKIMFAIGLILASTSITFAQQNGRVDFDDIIAKQFKGNESHLQFYLKEKLVLTSTKIDTVTSWTKRGTAKVRYKRHDKQLKFKKGCKGTFVGWEGRAALIKFQDRGQTTLKFGSDVPNTGNAYTISGGATAAKSAVGKYDPNSGMARLAQQQKASAPQSKLDEDHVMVGDKVYAVSDKNDRIQINYDSSYDQNNKTTRVKGSKVKN